MRLRGCVPSGQHAETPLASARSRLATTGFFSPGVPVPEATPVTEQDWLALLGPATRDTGTAELAQHLDRVHIVQTAASARAGPLPGLLEAIDSAFANLPSVEASFRPPVPETAGQTRRRRVPTWQTVRHVYDVVTERPAAVENLRERVDAVLQRPGPTLLDSDGTWLITLFEVRLNLRSCDMTLKSMPDCGMAQCPVFTARVTPDPPVRHRLQARLIGLYISPVTVSPGRSTSSSTSPLPGSAESLTSQTRCITPS